MAKFNTANTMKTENRCGNAAYKMNEKEHLVTAVLTTMFGEEKFYGSTDEDIVRIATDFCGKDPEFVSKLACYARNEFYMRSVSHVLTAIIAREASEFTRQTVDSVVKRADDITEIMACYLAMYGKPFPNALKRAIADAMQKFDEYQIAKYNGGNKSMKFRDVLRITHPVPKSKEVEELFGKILDDTLETPYTWETELSARGNSKEVWDELIASGRVGYMALLRNLKNMIRAKADLEPVLKIIADPVQVKKSKQLPFRFYSAYKKLDSESLMTPEIHKALESAILASIDNMDMIMGRTLVAVDVSASMGGNRISGNSDVKCADIASLFGAMASRLCEDAAICYFDTAYEWNWRLGRQKTTRSGYRIAHYGKFDSVLDIALKNAFSGGGTDLSLPMEYALEDGVRTLKPFDRVIYFSDNECNCGKETVQTLADAYRAKYNKDFWVHAIDLQGYGTQQFIGSRFNLIAGWSEKVFAFIHLAEAGAGSLVKEIEAYKC